VHIFSQKVYQIVFCIAVTSQIFSSTVAERRKALEQQAAIAATKPKLDGKRDANAVLGKSVKTAEATTSHLFTQHYTSAATDATYAKRQQINLWRIKMFQATHTTPAFFDPTHATGVKAKPEHFNPALDAANLAMAAAYAPYNNCSRVSKSDVASFAAKYPHEVAGLNLASLEGDLLPPNAEGKAFAYNPFSYGMVLVYRLRHANKLGGESPATIDLYNKEKAFEWESAAGMAKESVGSGAAHVAPAVAVPSTKIARPSAPPLTQKMVVDAKARLKTHSAPAA
jgi:hypothetical protein